MKVLWIFKAFNLKQEKLSFIANWARFIFFKRIQKQGDYIEVPHPTMVIKWHSILAKLYTELPKSDWEFFDTNGRFSNMCTLQIYWKNTLVSFNEGFNHFFFLSNKWGRSIWPLLITKCKIMEKHIFKYKPVGLLNVSWHSCDSPFIE